MIVAVLLRDRPNSAAVRLSVALYVCAIAYAIREAPTFPWPWPWWSLPLAVVGWGSSSVFWLWAQTTFDDEFALRRWHAALWAAMVGLGLFVWKGGAIWPSLGMVSDRARALAELALALLAVSQTFATWRADLVAGRRRLRIVVLIGAFAYVVAWPLTDLSIRLMAPALLWAASSTPSASVSWRWSALGACFKPRDAIKAPGLSPRSAMALVKQGRSFPPERTGALRSSPLCCAAWSA